MGEKKGAAAAASKIAAKKAKKAKAAKMEKKEKKQRLNVIPMPIRFRGYIGQGSLCLGPYEVTQGSFITIDEARMGGGACSHGRNGQGTAKQTG